MTRRQSEFVGRAEELGHLQERWSRAKAGGGGGVVVLGEAGIGKSRLAGELGRHVQVEAATVVRLHGSRQHSNSDFHPLVAYLLRACGMRRGDPDVLRRARIADAIARAGVDQSSGALLRALVRLTDESAGLEDPHAPRSSRDADIDAIVDGVAEMAAAQPTLIICDDVQWMDPTTVELLHRFVVKAERQRLLVVLTARREFAPEWIGEHPVSLLILRRLAMAETRRLAVAAAGAAPLAPDELDRVAERSEGVPLYIEELARNLLTQRNQPDGATGVPASLQDLLGSRLDALGCDKAFAQTVAALGRQFSHEFGALLWNGTPDEYPRLIERLMAAEVLRPAPVSDGAHYIFRHALIQDAAYNSQTVDQQQALHARIVAILEQLGPSNSDQPEIFAYHCERAALPSKSALYRLNAGKAAARRGSVVEAVNEFKLGLASAQAMADDEERERLLYNLNMNLGPALMALQGYASQEAISAFTEARRWLRLSRSSVEQVHVFLGLFNGYLGRGELTRAYDVARQADEALAVGYGGYPVLRGEVLCLMGRPVEAKAALQSALAKYDPTIDAQSGLFCRADVVASSFLAKTEFALGNIARSGELTQTAMAMAREQGHPIALAVAYLGEIFFATEMGRLEHAQTLADEALVHASRHDLSNYVLWSSFYREALYLRIDPMVAIAGMERTLQMAIEANMLMFRASHLGLLGAAYGMVGRHEAGLRTIDEGIQLANETLWLETLPALLRIRSKMMMALKRPADAIRDADQARSVARGQSARTEELRAAMLLAHYLRNSEHAEAAFDRVASLYANFDKMLLTPDLAHAKDMPGFFNRQS